MNLAEDLVEISKANLTDIADAIERSGRPKLVTKDGIGNLVVLPVSEYEGMKESLEVAAGLLQGAQDLAAGRVRSNAEVQERLQARMAAAVGAPGEPKSGD